MNKDVKERWIKALRSGKYKQARSTLHDEVTDGMCCLGVLSLIEFGDARAKQDIGGAELLAKGYIESIGLTECDMDDLVQMNDGQRYNGKLVNRKTFQGIATYIEKNL